MATDPASLEVPIWKPGTKWNYTTGNGSDVRTMKWTVSSLMEHNGRPTYYVKTHVRPPDNYGQQDYEFWLAQDSLGVVATNQGIYVQTDCEPGRLFPMVEHTDYCNQETGSSSSQSYLLEYHVGNWSSIRTGVGEFDSIEVWMIELENNETLQHGWYSPDLGYFSKYLVGKKEYVLDSVHRSP